MSHKHKFEIHDDFTSAHAANSNAAPPPTENPAPARRERSVPLVDDSDTDIENAPPGYVQIINAVKSFCTPMLPILWSYAAKFLTLTKGGYVMIGGGVVAGVAIAAAFAAQMLSRKKSTEEPSNTANAVAPREPKTSPKIDAAKKQSRTTQSDATAAPRWDWRTKVAIGSTAAAVVVAVATSLAVLKFRKAEVTTPTDDPVAIAKNENFVSPNETAPPLTSPSFTSQPNAASQNAWTPVVASPAASTPPILPTTPTPVPNLFAADTLPPITSSAPKSAPFAEPPPVVTPLAVSPLAVSPPEVVSTPIEREPLVPSRSAFELAKPAETPRPLVAATPEKTAPEKPTTAISEPVAVAAAGLGAAALVAAASKSSPSLSTAPLSTTVQPTTALSTIPDNTKSPYEVTPPLSALPRASEPVVSETPASNATLATPFTPPPTATQSQTEPIVAASDSIVAPSEPFVSLVSTKPVVAAIPHSKEESPAVPADSVIQAVPVSPNMASVVERVQDVQRNIARSPLAPAANVTAPIVVEDAPFLPESEDITSLLPRHSAAAPTLVASAVPMPVPMSQPSSIPPLVVADVQPKYQTASPPTDQSLSAFAPLQGAPNVSPVPQPGSLYRAQTGDNFWTISQSAYGSPKWYRDLAFYNRARVTNPAQIEGAVIDIPTTDALQRFAAQETAAKTAQQRPDNAVSATRAGNGSPAATATFTPRSSEQPPAGSTIYIVQSGETLASIAEAKLGSRQMASEIARLNPQKVGTNGTVIAGTELFIPRSQSRQSTAAYTRRTF